MNRTAASAKSPRAGVATSVEGRVGWLTLDRPRTLNALTTDMIDTFAAGLAAHEANAAIHVIAVRSTSERAFCAGGDMKHIRELVLEAEYAPVDEFFEREYALNLAIASCRKPYVALIDGVAMGGGLGLSIHGSHRVLTEYALLGMPETRIGLFPDVGGSHFLPRLPHKAGWWLALAAATLRGAEGVHIGLGTHAVAHDALPALVDALVHDDDAVDEVLARFARPVFDEAFQERLVTREPWFAAEERLRLLGDLEKAAASHPDAASLHDAVRAGSPFAVSATLEVFDGSLGRTLAQNLERERAAMHEAIRHPDFVEGVRAALIDKDKTPRWAS